MNTNNACDKPEDKDKVNEPADFEQAMNEAGFGCFNLLLLLVATAGSFANMFESTTISYILPVAECDLKLSLIDKGSLNAVTYAGMITSAIAWGYLADTQGRKKILVYGYLADAVCVFGSSLSQNFEMLAFFKFFGGFFVNGPGAVLFTYLAEMHSAKQRPRVLMILGTVTSAGTLVVPVLAWAIFPRDWHFQLFDFFNVHSWQIFLAVCSLASLSSSLLIMLMPESPKFLMSQGRNAEALRAFQKIYAFNTRKPRDSYPIRELIEEVPNREGTVNEVVFTIENKQSKAKPKLEKRTFQQALRDGMTQMKPLFRKPLLGQSIHFYAMQFCILLGLNTIRLWLPQLFASIAEYEALAPTLKTDSNLCTILEYSVNKSAENVENFASNNCDTPYNVSMDMYTNNIIVSAASVVSYLGASTIVKKVGGKRMTILGLFISGCTGLSLYWSSSGLSTLIISCIFASVAGISTSSLLSVAVALFPTSLRTIVVSVSMMFGRLGALSGNVLFPVFVEIGCIPPFLMVSCAMLFASALACLLPGTKKTVFT